MSTASGHTTEQQSARWLITEEVTCIQLYMAEVNIWKLIISLMRLFLWRIFNSIFKMCFKSVSLILFVINYIFTSFSATMPLWQKNPKTKQFKIPMYYVVYKPVLVFCCMFRIKPFLRLLLDLQRREASELYRWLWRPQKQLDALRQPGSLPGRTEPGGLPEQRRHLLLHHPAGGSQPGVASMVQPRVCPEALQPAGWHQTK